MTDTPDIDAFRELVLGFWRDYGRHDLPWRANHDPYPVLLSEIMLQQTQVTRVAPRFLAWLDRFPSIDALAAAPLSAVLEEWQGLGYNRRAVALKRAAETVSDEFGGVVPGELESLMGLSGVGPATAAGVRVFAYSLPARYLETNVRAVVLHHFFREADRVRDCDILPLLDLLLGEQDPRTWYWALLDYGAHLKRTVPNPSRRSAHHARQSVFEGSRRQRRARLLREVMAEPGLGADEYAERLGIDHQEAGEILSDLADEGFLSAADDRYGIR